MQVSKEIYNLVISELKEKIRKLDIERRNNKYKINQLAKAQKEIKLKQTALVDIIRTIDKKVKGK